MIAILRSLALDCFVVFGGGLALVAMLRFGAAIFDTLPMTRARRITVGRLRPLVAVLLIGVYAIMATRWVLASADAREWIAFAAVAAILAAAAWPVIRDGVEGVLLRTSKALVVGEQIEIAGVRGRLAQLGARAITVETTAGELAVVPYRQVSAAIVRRKPVAEQSAFHLFRVAIPEQCSIVELKRAVHEAALLCHWCSTRRPPSVVATDDGQLEITVFPIDANHVTEIERVVRRAVERG